MRVCVLGATGVLGRHLLPRLAERGHVVRAIVRPGTTTSLMAALGIEIVKGDIFEPVGLRAAVDGCDAAIHAATAIPAAGKSSDWSLNDRIRREGTRNFVAACEQAGINIYIQQSIAHVAADGTSELRDETAPLEPTPRTSSAVEMEEFVKHSAMRWVILRGGIFYGRYTGQDAAWRAAARAGELQIPGNGTDYISLVHVADYAQAVVETLGNGAVSGIFNVVDDEPVTYRDFFNYIAAIEGVPAPSDSGPKLWNSFRVSHKRFRAATDWRPAYPTYRSGWIA
jgi:nucleoside-diphosphate-sugar epimerase